jgi:hypothetical protein
MAKNESTAINDLIHLVQGKIIDHGSDGTDEPMFVTAPRLAPAGPLPPPLPRRRAPNATPPAQLLAQYDDDDDDSQTQVDPHALLAWGNPDALPQPVLPQYSFQTPAPLPPVPTRPEPTRNDATERVERYAPVPVPAWAAAQPRPAPVPSSGFDVMETVRVAALPPPAERSRFGAVARYVVPAGVAAIAIGCVAGFLLHHKQPPADAPAPIVMQVSPPAAAPTTHAESAALAAAMAPPIVTPIAGAASDAVAPAVAPAAAAPPTVTSTGEAIGWKPMAVQPTIAPTPVEPAPVAVAAAEPVAAPAAAEPVAEPAAASDDEIEMTATAAKHHHHHSATVQRVARVAPPAPKAVAAPRRRSADPVAVALAEPTQPAKAAAKGTGPGKVTITSTPAALIYVDGRSTNMMTPKTLPLSAGTHKITLLEVRSRKAKTQEIDVAAGGTAQIAKNF